ncbi:MAG TPA: sterol desaturase family protein [Burkholderiales bacterium]|nr:sterol desaturase family protein [Burkholderiales bacterium]
MLRLDPAGRARWGKRAGVSSGLLGMLCVLGELCFLLPDWLVTRDALPFYRAHIDFFRGLLQTAIFATFALGAASVVLLRSKAHGLLGIGLGAVALAMGGAGAQALDVGRPGVSAGIDYLVLELLVLGLVFIPLERVFALRAQDIFRRGWQTDLKHFFVSHAGVQLISLASMVPAQLLFSRLTGSEFQRAVAAQPIVLQFVEIVLTVDFVAYWVHRAFHRVPWLWNFHAIHHSSQQLDWLAGSRMHVVDVFVTRAAGFLPVFLFGFAQAAVYAYIAVVSFHAVYLHSNTRWRWPLLRWIVTTPEYHHWHHTSDEEGIDKNYAGMLPVLDVLFRTAHLPDYWPKRYGTVKFQPPESWLGQLYYPFRRHRGGTPYG